MSITVGDVLRVVATLAWTDGDIMQNVFNAVITGSGGPFDDADIVDDALAWIGAIFANLSAYQTTSLDGSEVTVYLYDSIDEDWDEVGSDAWVYNPVNVQDYLARGVAALINANTSNADVQGKKYFGGFGEDSAADGAWGGALLADLSNAFDDWVTAFVGATSGASWTPAIWSPTKANAFVLDGTGTIPAVNAYQRRRKPGVGI